MNSTFHELTCPGLQGSNLLGFLAALGAFHTLSTLPESEDVRMRWIAEGSSYCPVFRLSKSSNPDGIVQSLHSALTGRAGHYVTAVDKDLKIPCAVFRKLAAKAAEDYLTLADVTAADIVASFGCDAVGNDDGLIEDTAFRTMSGAGHQHFLEFMQVLAKETTMEQLGEALFGPWRYRDPSPTMRWDAEDDRRYALRWDEPSKDPVRTVRGANLLATAALSLFPTAPQQGGELATVGFKGKGSRNTYITWPIWTTNLSLDTIRSVLSLADLQKDRVKVEIFRARGIAAVYRSQRITLGKYRNFTPSQPL